MPLNGFFLAFDTSTLDVGWQLLVCCFFLFVLSNSTREVEIKLTFKCVDENTNWKIHVQVLSIQNVNFCSPAITTQTPFSHVCT